MTPSTPSIGHIFALQSKLDEIFDEGLTNRYERHARTNALVHDWMRARGFDFFAEENFRSKTLTCVKNNRGIDVLKLAKICAKNIISSSMPATANSKAKPSAFPIWAMRLRRPFHICSRAWTIVSSNTRSSGERGVCSSDIHLQTCARDSALLA